MILIPARNEGPRIGPVVRATLAAMPGVMVVVVANGCTDDTRDQAEAAGATVISSAPGYGAALLAGYRHALQHWKTGEHPRWLVQLDADGQHPPEAIPAMVQMLQSTHLVIGSRLVHGGGAQGWPWSRRLAVGALGWWTRRVSGAPVRDIASGFQAMQPSVVQTLVEDFPVDMVDANVLVRLWRQGFSIRELGVEMSARQGGQSMHGGWHSALYAGRMALQASREARR
jgi:glycosyltransferase involved in cell wall biosynthesis